MRPILGRLFGFVGFGTQILDKMGNHKGRARIRGRCGSGFLRVATCGCGGGCVYLGLWGRGWKCVVVVMLGWWWSCRSAFVGGKNGMGDGQ